MALPQRWIVLAGLFMARFAFGFHMQTMAVVAGGARAEFGFSHTEIGFLIGVFMAPGVILAFPGGALAQRYGDRRVITISLLVMVAGGLITGFAGSFWVMTLGRVLAGAGSVLIVVSSTKATIDWFSGKEVATAMAINLSGYPIGIAVVLAGMSELGASADWRLCFLIAAAVSLAGLVAFLLTFRGVKSGAGNNALPTRMTRREVGAIGFVGTTWGAYNACYLIMLSFVPAFLVTRGFTTLEAANLVGLMPFSSLIAIPIGGIIADRLGRPGLLVYGGGICWILTIYGLYAAGNHFAALASFIIIGALVSAPAAGVIVSSAGEAVQASARGHAMGQFYSIFYVISLATPPLAGLVLDLSGNHDFMLLLMGLALLIAITCYAGFRSLASRQRA